MKNRIKVACDQNVVTNAEIAILDENDEWLDIRNFIRRVVLDLEVGKVSTAKLEVLMVDTEVEAFRIDFATQKAFAKLLEEHGWTVTPGFMSPDREDDGA